MPSITRSKNPAIVVDKPAGTPTAAPGTVSTTKKAAALKKKAAAKSNVEANVAQMAEYEAQLEAEQNNNKVTAANPQVAARKKVGRPLKETKVPKAKAKGKGAAGKKQNAEVEPKRVEPDSEIVDRMDVDKLPLVSV